jgi:hypothetical protein
MIYRSIVTDLDLAIGFTGDRKAGASFEPETCLRATEGEVLSSLGFIFIDN